MEDVTYPEESARVPVLQTAISLSYERATGPGIMIAHVTQETFEVVLNKPSLQYPRNLSLRLYFYIIRARMIKR